MTLNEYILGCTWDSLCMQSREMIKIYRLDDLMLLDINDDQTDDLDLLTDFEKSDDLLSFDQSLSDQKRSSFQQDLIDIFESQQEPQNDQDPC